MRSLLRRNGIVPLLLLVLPMIAGVQGCASIRSFFGETYDITVTVENVANDERPIAVNIVYVYDEDLLKEVLKMTAQEWFEKRRQFENVPSDVSHLEIFDFEWVPGTVRREQELPLRVGVCGAVMFANYFFEGQYRQQLDPFHDIAVLFKYDDFIIVPEGMAYPESEGNTSMLNGK